MERAPFMLVGRNSEIELLIHGKPPMHESLQRSGIRRVTAHATNQHRTTQHAWARERLRGGGKPSDLPPWRVPR